MMRAGFLLLLVSGSLAASAPVAPAADPLDAALVAARAEAAAASKEARRLSELAGKQQDEASKLRAQQEASALLKRQFDMGLGHGGDDVTFEDTVPELELALHPVH